MKAVGQDTGVVRKPVSAGASSVANAELLKDLQAARTGVRANSGSKPAGAGKAGPSAQAKVQSPAATPTPDEQAKALGKMSDAEFKTYLQHVPATNAKDQLAVLTAMKDHPDRKLAVWAEMHHAQVEQDLDTDMRKHGSTEADLDWMVRRENTNTATHAEVKEEKAFLEEKLKGVDAKDPAQVAKFNAEIDEMMLRKDKEHEIERKYNVNLTNAVGKSGVRNDVDHSKVAWDLPQLDHLDAALEHVAKNKSPDGEMHEDMKIYEFHRATDNYEWEKDAATGEPKLDTNGDKIPVYLKNDDGTFKLDGSGNKTRTGGDNAENFHNGRINIYDKSENGGPAHPPLKREFEDPDFIKRHGEFDSFQERVMTHEMGHSAHDQTPDVLNDYERILKRGRPDGQKAEYLAEDFKNAQIHPVDFAKDCFVTPRENLKRDEAARAKETDPVKQADLDKKIADDRYTITAWPEMHAALRTKVFHGDVAEADAVARLEGMHLPPGEVAEFRRQAKYLATPESIDRLAEKYAFQEPDRHKIVDITDNP